MHRVLCGLLLALLAGLAVEASADEGNIRARTPLLAAPSGDAAALGVLAPGARVTVAGDVQDGYRKVRTAEGAEGFVSAELVHLLAVDAPTPIAANVLLPPANLRPRAALMYVSSPEDLLARTVDDEVVSSAASRMLRTRQTATGVMWGSVVAGALTALASTFVETCETVGTGLSRERVCAEGNRTVFRVGLGIAAAGPLLGALFLPSRSDVAEAVQLWNERHPDDRLAVP